MKHGNGKYSHANGDIFEGEWVYDCKKNSGEC